MAVGVLGRPRSGPREMSPLPTRLRDQRHRPPGWHVRRESASQLSRAPLHTSRGLLQELNLHWGSGPPGVKFQQQRSDHGKASGARSASQTPYAHRVCHALGLGRRSQPQCQGSEGWDTEPQETPCLGFLDISHHPHLGGGWRVTCVGWLIRGQISTPVQGQEA